MGYGAGVRLIAAPFAIVVAMWIVLVARIGPVVAVVDADHGHGIHSGDVLALPFLLVAAWTLAADLRRSLASA